MKETLQERFWSKVKMDKFDECWPWKGSRNPNGYGRIRVTKPYRQLAYAHRVSWELSEGPIPDGMEIDHLCRNRACVNPRHLEVVTHRDNTLRGASPKCRAYRENRCVHGHPLTKDNVYNPPTRPWARHCLTCKKSWRAHGPLV